MRGRVYFYFVLVEQGQIVSRPEIGMGFYFIAPTFFGGKEALICQVDQSEGIRCLEWKDCNTLADGGSLYRLILPIFQDQVMQGLADALGNVDCLGTGGARQGNGKLFASPTAKNIGILDGMLNRFGQRSAWVELYNGDTNAINLTAGTVRVTNNSTFNTFLATDLYIDASDYNYTNGLFVNSSTPSNAYANLLGTNGVDYSISDLTGTNNTVVETTVPRMFFRLVK